MSANDDFNKYSGEILRIALNVELEIEKFIFQYFFDTKNNKIDLFKDSFLSHMTFDRKSKLLKMIYDFENIPEESQDVLQEIDFVRTTRNKIAHGLSEYREDIDDIVLREKKSEDKDFLRVDQQLVTNISDKYFSIRKKMIDIQNILVESGRFKPTPIDNAVCL